MPVLRDFVFYRLSRPSDRAQLGPGRARSAFHAGSKLPRYFTALCTSAHYTAMVSGLDPLRVVDGCTTVAVHVHTSADCSRAEQHLRSPSASHLARFKILFSWLHCIVARNVTLLLIRVNVEVCVARCNDPSFGAQAAQQYSSQSTALQTHG